jgi:flagellar hook-associated protein 3 FlgL
MRLSTQGFYTGSLAAMQQQAAELAKLQNQVALGRRVSSPADDPIAAVHIIDLERAQSASEQYGKNSALLRNRLNLEEQALADANLVLTRVRELTLQASNIGTLSDADRRSIATELASRLNEMQDIANRQDGNGEHLFGGFSTLSRPFVGGGASPVDYVGDQGSRVLQISSSQSVSDSHSGFDAFVDIPAGNGLFTTEFSAGNTGTGAIDVGTILERGSWVPDAYTITFTSPTDWSVTDSGGNPVSAGTYTPGAPIEFNGVRVEITGDPATNDSFTVAQSRNEDVFATISNVIAALRTPGDSEVANSRLSQVLERSLQQFDQASEHLLSVRSEVGARLSTVDSADASRESLDVDLASALSDLRDLDYAEALTKMNQRLVGLQAAQMSYAQIAQLSLFDYLR